MVKYLTTIIAICMLAGCATTQHVQLVTKVQPIAVPLIYSPAPPVVTRPVLPIDTIKPTDSPGVVAKKYAATIQALIGYSKELEKIVGNYQHINQAYASVRKQLIAKWKKKTGKTLTIPDPTLPKSKHK